MRDGRKFAEQKRVVRAPQSYSFVIPLRPGLVRYNMVLEFHAGREIRVIYSATNLVCGDAFVLQGQSNAVATDWGDDEPTFHSEWIRTFGSMSARSTSRTCFKPLAPSWIEGGIETKNWWRAAAVRTT